MKRNALIIALCACAFAALTLTVSAGPEPLPSGKEMKQVVPAPAPECTWTGFYIGLNVGGQFGHSENKDLRAGPTGTVTEFYNFPDKPWGYSESGVIAGGQVGYNFQWNWLVLGLEADGGYMNLEGSGVEPGSPGGDTRGESDSDFYTTIRGRVGVARGHWLLYATGGAIGVNYETRVVDDCADTIIGVGCGGTLIDAHKRELNWGWTVGGGLEYMLACHWSVKAEYLYFMLDEQKFSGLDFDLFINDTDGRFFFNGETTGHIVRAGLNYKF